MFKNLVANLAFSPSVVNSIGFYVNRLKKEEFTRRLGLIFSVLAIILQTFAIINPPEPTMAAGPNNIIYSGVTSLDDLLIRYDQNNDGSNHNDIQKIFEHYGISRNDLANAKIATIKSTDHSKKMVSVGRKAYGKTGEVAIPIPGTNTTIYQRPLWSWDSGAYSTYKVIQGTTSDGRWFAVIMSCGNIVVDEPPPAPQNPIGQVSHTCNTITGWAYDPNQPGQSSKISVSIRLDGKTDPTYKVITYANLPEPKAPVSGNHGFSVTIPEDRKSATANTIYTAVALDTFGGGEDISLAKTVYIKPFCLTPITPPPVTPPPTPPVSDPPITVCNIKTGAIETIKQSQNDESIYSIASQCDDIKICQNDKIITINKYQYSGQPKNCPSIQVCRDGVIIAITTNLKKDTDLNVDQCQKIEVCRDSQLTTINKYERQGSDTSPHPTLICEDPFPVIVYNKTATNITQKIDDANGTTANPGDVIEYTLTAENIGTASSDVELKEDLSDVLEYADLIYYDGGQFDNLSKVLSWNKAKLEPDQSISKKITIGIKPQIVAAPSPINNLESNNLELRNVWHNDTIVIKVPRPVTKIPEDIARTLPNTGPGVNMSASFILVVFAAYFYARNRQLTKELKFIQHSYVPIGD